MANPLTCFTCLKSFAYCACRSQTDSINHAIQWTTTVRETKSNSDSKYKGLFERTYNGGRPLTYKPVESDWFPAYEAGCYAITFTVPGDDPMMKAAIIEDVWIYLNNRHPIIGGVIEMPQTHPHMHVVVKCDSNAKKTITAWYKRQIEDANLTWNAKVTVHFDKLTKKKWLPTMKYVDKPAKDPHIHGESEYMHNNDFRWQAELFPLFM